MSVRKKRPSASDVLRQEMQQPLVIPARNPNPEPNPTPTTIINMTPPTNDDAATAAKLKQVQESEAKLQQQIEDLNSKLKAQADTIVKLAEQAQAPAKNKGNTAIVKKDTSRSNASITARPTESREETARRRANTDIGWLD
jgi:hypothetical protein